MKKSQLKSTLKPLIKECIKEVLFEEGVLSGVIAEVVRGTQSLSPPPQPTLQTEQIQKQPLIKAEEQKRILEQKWEQDRERRKKLLDATGFKGVDLFEGTEPLSKGGNPGSTASTQGSLTGVDPEDAGIDISGIMAVGNGKKWKDLI
tara:strand:+ start:248 stop:688 length:441 start_codon:yes stop_codon:yes gene_type:complete